MGEEDGDDDDDNDDNDNDNGDNDNDNDNGDDIEGVAGPAITLDDPGVALSALNRMLESSHRQLAYTQRSETRMNSLVGVFMSVRLHAVSPPDYDEDVARGPGISGVGSENDGANE